MTRMARALHPHEFLERNRGISIRSYQAAEELSVRSHPALFLPVALTYERLTGCSKCSAFSPTKPRRASGEEAAVADSGGRVSEPPERDGHTQAVGPAARVLDLRCGSLQSVATWQEGAQQLVVTPVRAEGQGFVWVQAM